MTADDSADCEGCEDEVFPSRAASTGRKADDSTDESTVDRAGDRAVAVRIHTRDGAVGAVAVRSEPEAVLRMAGTVVRIPALEASSAADREDFPGRPGSA